MNITKQLDKGTQQRDFSQKQNTKNPHQNFKKKNKP